MFDFIIQIVMGSIFIAIGISNMKGNISLLHSYHRKRLKEEDIIHFGKKIGTGIIIIGCTIIMAGILELLISGNYIYIINIVLMFGFIPGIIIILYALFKYNKGIF